MPTLEEFSQRFVDAVWGTPLVALLLGGGIFFLFYSRALPYRHFGHAVGIMLGRHDTPGEAGELSHGQALAAALSGTMGLGNIAGVSLAIVAGGPGAVFWMWISALVGVATKFFTCSLGVMYRGEDSMGKLQGGPMYIIREALPRQFYPLAILFAVAGLVGTLPLFQANQLTALIGDTVFNGNMPGWGGPTIGICIACLVAGVIFGGLPRVAKVAVAVLPSMVVVYMLMTLYVIISNAALVPAVFASIVTEAFTPQAAGGGFIGTLLIGISRGAFSNEAGVGTEVMAHGAARTNEPIREGLVAMLGPVIDTLLVCTCTALVILLTGQWQVPGELSGITLTANAFVGEMGHFGLIPLAFVTLILSTTTMFTGWYYGAKCFGFLFGAEVQHHFRWVFVGTVIVGASVSIDMVFNIISGAYGLMAIPTMVSTLVLAPKVMAAAREYFARHPY
ncbi:alanine/glycine:cation symporter family protein [Congregibacter litoralis]|uniref:Amino acid carrier protein n=1 Tax=Congregibacter litoralis KT71 TaxID=314285 RepID=A4A8Z9_9GAMM|nr:amino acid carrier protein [Congregibacter litoralis]EAQ97541.1 amino acid carrier protein [Congregibacter litoralis KT71]